MVPPDDGGEGGGGERNDDEGHVHEMPLVQLVLGLGSGHWYVLVVWMSQPFGAGSSCGIVPLKELSLRYLRTKRGTTAGGEWEKGKGQSGERGRERVFVGAMCQPDTCHHSPRPLRPLPPHAAGRAAAERGGRT